MIGLGSDKYNQMKVYDVCYEEYKWTKSLQIADVAGLLKECNERKGMDMDTIEPGLCKKHI